MIVDSLRRDGVVMVPGLTKAQARDVMAHLQIKPIYDGHVKGQGRIASRDSSQTCWSMDDVVQVPHVWDYALSLTDVVGDYLGADPPLMYSVNAFTMYPNSGQTSRDTQEFHRDKDDTRFVALFIYLTDVLEIEDGAHQFMLGTHTAGSPTGDVVNITGPAGTAFLSDGRGLHRGIRPSKQFRSILWVRWGVSDPPPSYVWDRLSPVHRSVLWHRYPRDERLQRSVRLVVQ